MNRITSFSTYFLTCCIIAVFIAGMGCISPSSQPGIEPPNETISPTPSPELHVHLSTLEGTTWELVSYDSGRIAQESVTTGSTVTARFDTGGVVYGSSGCNQYCASYESADLRLLISTPQRTLERCHAPPGVETQEKVFLLDLERVRTYSIEGDLLRLMDENGRVTLLFRKGNIPPDAPQISWKTWHLIAYRDHAETMIPPPGGMVMTARFLDGTLSGFAGCNCYKATYREDGGAITIGEPVLSDTRCRNETVMGMEGAFFDNLKDVAAYIADTDSLQLVDSRGEALLVFHSNAT